MTVWVTPFPEFMLLGGVDVGGIYMEEGDPYEAMHSDVQKCQEAQVNTRREHTLHTVIIVTAVTPV